LIQKQLFVISRIIFFKVVLAIALLALIINLLRYVLKEVLQLNHPTQGPEQLLALPIYAALPLLPLSLPTLLQISKAFTNATILVLFNTLQISKTEYEDELDVDEFDVEAPPPTKNVDIARKEVWKRFWRLLTRWGNSGQDFDDGLTRSTNLVESLGGITVICSIDKEGTIATAFPAVEQVFVATEDEDTAVLDVLEDDISPNGLRFEDKDWESYIQSLKPIGLNQLLNTNCSTLSAGRRREAHRKCNTLHYHCKTRAAQQTCLCRLGREIGFTSEALYPFTLQKEIMCYHPYVPMPPMTFGKLTTFEIPTMLSTIYHERASDSYMVLTDGHVECVVECCTEYWDGKGLQDLDDAVSYLSVCCTCH
jgi:magnesium-transporting ATPase (P-type)